MAVEAYKAGEIEGNQDLELINIDKFITNIDEVADELIVGVDRVLEDLGRLIEVEEGDNSSIQQEGNSEPHQTPTKRQSPIIKGKNTGGSASLPSPTTKRRLPTKAQVSEAAEPQREGAHQHRPIGNH